MKVWLVGISDAEGSSIKHICKTKELAVKRLFEERDELIKEWKRLAKKFPESADRYKEMIKNLSSDDYEHWNNFPQDEPWIKEWKVEE